MTAGLAKVAQTSLIHFERSKPPPHPRVVALDACNTLCIGALSLQVEPRGDCQVLSLRVILPKVARFLVLEVRETECGLVLIERVLFLIVGSRGY